ncbi:MAG: hypothetical protein DWQ36_06700 [Acidobacteria bacterium]|nr:MAG: hypothetical protein DWQ30_24135 [Acidobacteriota bacterium]REK09238.1 MAG: hypothetical protein DWQ36_06700 [Acidobacteriota bacterium]
MRDGIALARRGLPAVALVTSEFRAQADFVATAAGMPDLPRVVLPHPIAGTGRDNHRRVAEQFAERILAALTGGASDPAGAR